MPIENPLNINNIFAFSTLIIVLSPLVALTWVIKDVYIFDLNIRNYQLVYFLSVAIPFAFYIIFKPSFLDLFEIVGGIFIVILYFLIYYLGLKKKIISFSVFLVLILFLILTLSLSIYDLIKLL